MVARVARTRARGPILHRGERATYLVRLLNKTHPRHLGPRNLRTGNASKSAQVSALTLNGRGQCVSQGASSSTARPTPAEGKLRSGASKGRVDTLTSRKAESMVLSTRAATALSSCLARSTDIV
eukprot:380372-Rhodomonas_salina.11